MEPVIQGAVPGSYRFLEWIDLEQNGVMIECAILKKFPNGDTYFFALSSLDNIDKQRLRNILVHKSASLYCELWSMLEQHTLGNGMNALLYFNQLAKLRTASGQMLPFGGGQKGAVQQQSQPTASQNFEALAKSKAAVK